ncbi:MAG: hypothetical protein QG567_2392 [Campylobacterota bacterium]|nr:hypothetical protein [Campylobacterota bacterium]
MKLEDFMRKNKPLKKVSALEPYREEIKTLLDNNYTQEQILEFLKISKKVQVSRQSLSSFLKKNKHKAAPLKLDEKKKVLEKSQEVSSANQDLDAYFAKYKK